MPREHFGNQFATILSDAITFQDDTIRVADASGFPQLQFRVRIGNELLIVDQVMPDLQSFHVIRGAEDTNPAAHAQNSAVTVVATTGGLEQWLADSYSEVPHGTPGNPEWRFLGTETGLVYIDDTSSGSGIGSVIHTSRGLESLRTFAGGIGVKGDIYLVGIVSEDEDYPVHDALGAGGGRRIRGAMSGDEEANMFAFQDVRPDGSTTVQFMPSGSAVQSGIRFHDVSEPRPDAGGYLDISLIGPSDSPNRRVLVSTLLKRPPPGPQAGPPASYPIHFNAGDGMKMIIGMTGEGVTIGRVPTEQLPMPQPGYLSIYHGLEVGNSITGAESGDGIFQRYVKAASVMWGLEYSRSELITDWNDSHISGFYIADSADHAPQNDVFLALIVNDPVEGTQAQIAINPDDSREMYIRNYGGTGNAGWFKIFHEGNTLPVFGGSGIFPGPIGIGTLADLSNKGNGDLVVYNSITLHNEPGGLEGEFVGPTGSLKRQGGFRGLAVSNGAAEGPLSARFGVQVKPASGPDMGSAWMSYGGAPGGTEGPNPSDANGVAWRIGAASLVNSIPIKAELVSIGSAPAYFFRVLQNGTLDISGGITVGGNAAITGDLVAANLTARSGSAFVLAHALSQTATIRALAVGNENGPELVLDWAPVQTGQPDQKTPRYYAQAIDPTTGYFQLYVKKPPYAPDQPLPVALYADWNASLGVRRTPSGNAGDLSLFRSLHVGDAVLGTLAGEATALYHSSSVTISSTQITRQRMWASYNGTLANLSLGTNVSGQNEAAPVRDDPTKPSWIMRFGEQDALTVLRAAPGAGSPWQLLLNLDAAGNLVSTGAASIFSAINVGANLGALIGEVRMNGSLYLARQIPSTTVDQKIFVDITTSGATHTYMPFLNATNPGLWVVGGSGDGAWGIGRLQMRVGGATGTFEIADINGEVALHVLSDRSIATFGMGITVDPDYGADPPTPNAEAGDINVRRSFRAGRGELERPSIGFYRNDPEDYDESLIGLYFEEEDEGWGFSVAALETPKDSGSQPILPGEPRRSVQFMPLRTRFDSDVVPLQLANAQDWTAYNLGGQGYQSWRNAYIGQGITVGAHPDLDPEDYADTGKVWVYGRGEEVAAPQYILKLQEDSEIAQSGVRQYTSSILLIGQGLPTRPTMEIGITYMPPDGTVEGFEYTDRFEGRPTHFIDISRGDFIIGIAGDRRFHLNRFGSLGIGNVNPTEPDPDDPSPPAALGDMSISKSLIVGAVNASHSAGGSEGEIIATKITLTNGTVIGPGGDGEEGIGSQFSLPLVLANNVPIQSRLSSTGDLYSLLWLSPANDVYLQGTPDRKVIFRTMRTDSQDGELAEVTMHLWPNRGVVIGPLLGGTPAPPPSGLRVDGDVLFMAGINLGPDTTIMGLQFTDPDIPFIGVGIAPTEIPQMALLSQGEMAWGPGGEGDLNFDTWLRRRAVGVLEVQNSLYITQLLGVGQTPAYALDIRVQMADAWTIRAINTSPHGDGLFVSAGSDGTDTLLRLDNYPTANRNILTVDGSGGFSLNGSMAVTDLTLPDPYHPSTSRKGEIRCEYLVVRNSTQYQFGDGSGATIDIESAGLTLGNNVPLRAKDTTQTGRSILWVGTDNITHLRAATTQGLTIEGSATGTVGLKVTNAGSVSTGLATPSTNLGDLNVGRGLNVGLGVGGAVNGEVKASGNGYFGAIGVGLIGSLLGLIHSKGVSPQLMVEGTSTTAQIVLRVGSLDVGLISATAATLQIGSQAASSADTVELLTGGTVRHTFYPTGTATFIGGLNLGSETTAAVGEIRAASGHFTGNVVIDGSISAANLGGGGGGTVDALGSGSAGIPSLRWSASQQMGFYRVQDNVAGWSSAGIKRIELGTGLGVGVVAPSTSGRIHVQSLHITEGTALPAVSPTTQTDPFAMVVAGTGVIHATIATTLIQDTVNGASGSIPNHRSSIFLESADTVVGASSDIWFGVATAAGSVQGDGAFGFIKGVYTAIGGGNGPHGSIIIGVRGNQASGYYSIETLRISPYGVGIRRIPPSSATAGSLYAAGGIQVGTGTAPYDMGDGVVTANTGRFIGGGVGNSIGIPSVAINSSGIYAINASGSYVGNFFVNAGSLIFTLGDTTTALQGYRFYKNAFEFYLARTSVPESISALTMALATTTPQLRTYGDFRVDRGITIGTGSTFLAGPGEISMSGALDMAYQASPITPAASRLKIFPDSRGALKAKYPSGEEWDVVVKDSAVTNGDFDVWQRGTTFAGLTASANIADHWQTVQNIGTLTVTRVSDRPAAAQAGHYTQYCIDITSTVAVADASLVAGSLVALRQPIEGRIWQNYAGRPTGFGFWAKSNRANLRFTLALRSGVAGARYYYYEFFVTVADTWQFFAFSFPTSPSLFDFNYDHTLGVEVFIVLAAGSTAKGALGTSSGGWQAGSKVAGALQGNFLLTANSYLRLTHIRLEAADVTSGCPGQPWPDVLSDAQRYFVKTHPYDTAPVAAPATGIAGVLGGAIGALPGLTSWRFPVQMRTSPTVATFNPLAAGITWSTGQSPLVAGTSADGAMVYTSGGVASAGGVAMIHATADAEFATIAA